MVLTLYGFSYIMMNVCMLQINVFYRWDLFLPLKINKNTLCYVVYWEKGEGGEGRGYDKAVVENV